MSRRSRTGGGYICIYVAVGFTVQQKLTTLKTNYTKRNKTEVGRSFLCTIKDKFVPMAGKEEDMEGAIERKERKVQFTSKSLGEAEDGPFNLILIQEGTALPGVMVCPKAQWGVGNVDVRRPIAS